MSRNGFSWLVTALLLAPSPALACVLCGNLKSQPTLREEIKTAKVIVLGTLANPRLDPATGKGTTELHVQKVVKNASGQKVDRVIVLDRYLPVLDPKKPPRYLVFFDVIGGKLDPYHGRPVGSDAILEYLAAISKLGNRSRIEALKFYFRYLTHPDATIQSDAFLEFAKSSDADVGETAKALRSDVIRSLLLNPQTPRERLSLLAFLLGATGDAKQHDLLAKLIDNPSPRWRDALDGVLSGYIELNPKQGWQQVRRILSDPKQGFLRRYAAARVVRLYFNWKPKVYRDEILATLRVMLEQPDIADLALNDLRRWQVWDLTPMVLGLYDRKEYASPITRRAILRYALSCPEPQARALVARVRAAEPQLIRDLEESLGIEKKLIGGK